MYVRFKADRTTSKRIRNGFITVKSTTLIGLNSPRKNTTFPAIRSVEPRRTHIPPGGQGNGLVTSVHEFETSIAETPPYRVSRCPLNVVRLKRHPFDGMWKLEERCQLRCRPRHLTMVHNYEVRRQKPSSS
ncbi:hypothetical protein TNCV_4543581 [Trichonephila clavipes]|nr:hypothetical protein TNCV_4543581 [Trichonephila clavipes]